MFIENFLNPISFYCRKISHFSGICSLSPLALTINNVRIQKDINYVKYIPYIFNLFPDLNKQTILQLIHDTDMNETIFSLSLSSKIRKNEI